MFQERPLTWLFVGATFAIDLVLMSLGPGPDRNAVLRIGLVLGQLAAMAIWVARGKTHRLARMSCLVVAIGLLAYSIEVHPSPDSTSIWIAFCSVYVALIVTVTLLSDLIRMRFGKKRLIDSAERRWQVPLVECFGWTLVVAMVSFGARRMDFSFLEQDNVPLIAAFLAAPICMGSMIRRDVRDLSAGRALGISLILLFAAMSSTILEPSLAYVILIQAAYLVLWMAVRGMDDARYGVRSLRGSIEEEPLLVDSPQLFDPQD